MSFEECGAKCPSSVTSVWATPLGILGGSIGFFFLSYALNLQNFFWVMVGVLFCTLLPLLAVDVLFFKVHRRPSAGLIWGGKSSLVWSRVGIKILGLHVIWGFLGFCYWCFPEYQQEMYKNFFEGVFVCMPFVSLGSFFYIPFLDKRMVHPEDGLFKWGAFLLGRDRKKNKAAAQNYFLGWCVKGFYLPIMVGSLFINLLYLKEDLRVFLDASFLNQAKILISILFAIDVLYGSLGYILTFRLFDTHIRSTEPTALGWMVALICYPPFNAVWGTLVLHNEEAWYAFLQKIPGFLQISWILVALALVSIYVWATVIFGLRFSNLTNRGIITNGPYRFLKHPAYVSKNLLWWVLSVPFIQEGGLRVAVGASFGLLVVNFIYYLRAKTEERHLSADPAYQDYSAWMKKKRYGKRIKDYIFFKYTKFFHKYKKLLPNQL